MELDGKNIVKQVAELYTKGHKNILSFSCVSEKTISCKYFFATTIKFLSSLALDNNYCNSLKDFFPFMPGWHGGLMRWLSSILTNAL